MARGEGVTKVQEHAAAQLSRMRALKRGAASPALADITARKWHVACCFGTPRMALYRTC